MPKKRHTAWSTIKPTPSSSSTTSSNHDFTSSKPKSVNALLANLRITQPYLSEDPSSFSATRPGPLPAVPPSLQSLLGAAPPLPPRSRRNLLPSHPRRTPGPPPPPSWLVNESRTSSVGSRAASTAASTAGGIDAPRLPGQWIPEPRSLQAAMLKQITRDWGFHEVFDREYIQLLPAKVRSALLSGLSATLPVTVETLEILFPKDSCEDVTHLDLLHLGGGAGNGSVNLRELETFLAPPQTEQEQEQEQLEESWDCPLPTRKRFPNLTHLSLAYPEFPPTSLGGGVPWKALTKLLTSHCYSLTHLSLAGWPVPTVEGTLRRFARGLLCMKWVDFGDCGDGGLEAIADMDAELERIEWAGCWRGVERVVVAVPGEHMGGWHMAEVVRRQRKEAGMEGRLWEGVVVVGMS